MIGQAENAQQIANIVLEGFVAHFYFSGLKRAIARMFSR